MTQVIEIVVIGPVGSGKSHVLEILAHALRGEYGMHAQITSHELSLEKNLVHEPTKPRIAETIFNLREHGDVSFREISACRTRPKVDTLAAAPAIQGEAMRFMLDPLEHAIESTAQVMRDEFEHMSHISRTLSGSVPTTSLYKRMGDHLDALLAAQLKQVAKHEAR